MRKFIDKEEMLANVIELDNDWGHSVYCVLEGDVVDAPEEEAIDIDWIVDYVDMYLSGAEADVVKKMVGVWYDEWSVEMGKKKKPTLTQAYTKGFDVGSRMVKNEFVNAVKWMQEELQKRSAENGEQEEESTDTAVQE